MQTLTPCRSTSILTWQKCTGLQHRPCNCDKHLPSSCLHHVSGPGGKTLQTGTTSQHPQSICSVLIMPAVHACWQGCCGTQVTRCQPAVLAGEREPAASQEDPSKAAGEATEEAAPPASAPETGADEFLHAELDPASLDFPPLLELPEAVPVPVPKEDVAAQADRAQQHQAISVASTATDARHALRVWEAVSQVERLLAGPELRLAGACGGVRCQMQQWEDIGMNWEDIVMISWKARCAQQQGHAMTGCAGLDDRLDSAMTRGGMQAEDASL